MLYGKHEPAHTCPECGQETTGAHSEGGVRFALCSDCYRQRLERQRDEIDEELRNYREG